LKFNKEFRNKHGETQ